MHRSMILNTAIDISGERGKDHGDFDYSMEHIGKLIGLFCSAVIDNNQLPSANECPGFYAAMELCLVKISRIACGQPNADDFIDGCNYLAEAGALLLQWTQDKISSQNGIKDHHGGID